MFYDRFDNSRCAMDFSINAPSRDQRMSSKGKTKILPCQHIHHLLQLTLVTLQFVANHQILLPSRVT